MEDVESLVLTIDAEKIWDEEKEIFIDIPKTNIVLKHTLVSISKWEAKYHIPYMKEHKNITPEQALFYIKCMTINDVDDSIYDFLTEDHVMQIKKYIDDDMTATWFSEYAFHGETKHNNETITSELVYYWMTAFNIPQEYANWHFNRLMTLIKICSVKQEKPKKKSRRQIADENRALNAKRRAMFKSKG